MNIHPSILLLPALFLALAAVDFTIMGHLHAAAIALAAAEALRRYAPDLIASMTTYPSRWNIAAGIMSSIVVHMLVLQFVVVWDLASMSA